jgi:hypothetical protein
MKTKVIETHFVISPVISRINNEIEYDFIPLIKRVKYRKILGFWVPIKSQTIRQVLNDYIHSATFGEMLDYGPHWKKDLRIVNKTVYK